MSDDGSTLEQEIRADARKRADRVRQRVERDAQKVLREAREDAEEIQRRIMDDAQARAAQRERVQQARIRQELDRLRRRCFEDVLDRVQQEACRELRRLADGDDHRQTLIRLAVAAIRAMKGEQFQLVLRPQDADRWADELAEAVTEAVSEATGREVSVQVARERLQADGGLVVRGADGREAAEQTFGQRLERLWQELRSEVADRLVEAGIER